MAFDLDRLTYSDGLPSDGILPVEVFLDGVHVGFLSVNGPDPKAAWMKDTFSSFFRRYADAGGETSGDLNEPFKLADRTVFADKAFQPTPEDADAAAAEVARPKSAA